MEKLDKFLLIKIYKNLKFKELPKAMRVDKFVYSLYPEVVEAKNRDLAKITTKKCAEAVLIEKFTQEETNFIIRILKQIGRITVLIVDDMYKERIDEDENYEELPSYPYFRKYLRSKVVEYIMEMDKKNRGVGSGKLYTLLRKMGDNFDFVELAFIFLKRNEILEFISSYEPEDYQTFISKLLVKNYVFTKNSNEFLSDKRPGHEFEVWFEKLIDE